MQPYKIICWNLISVRESHSKETDYVDPLGSTFESYT